MTTETKLKALRRERRTQQDDRKAWRTGSAVNQWWGVPWCARPGGDHCEGTDGCIGCATATYCQDRAAQIDTTELERAIDALITPEEKELMAKLKDTADQIRHDLTTAQAAGLLPAVRLAVRVGNGRKTGPTATITVTGHEQLVGHPGRYPNWLEYQGELLLAQIDRVANRDGRDLDGITKFGILKGAEA